MKKIASALWIILFLISQGVVAQNYPNRPIRLIVAFSPGGSNDLLGRLIGQKIAENFGKNVIVENRPGAGGNIGTDFVAKSTPDGYTLLLGSTGPHAINPHFYSMMPYDARKDFTAISLIAKSSALLVVHPSIPANSVDQLIALARKRPGQLNYASSGNGSSGHLAGELFKTLAKIQMVHIAYKGNGPAFTDLIAGNVDTMFANKPGALPYVNANRLRAIGITSPKRDPTLPSLPAVAESVPGFEASTWWGILGPAGLPKDIVQKVHTVVGKAVASQEVQKRLTTMGADIADISSDAFGELLHKDYEKYGKIVKMSGMKTK